MGESVLETRKKEQHAAHAHWQSVVLPALLSAGPMFPLGRYPQVASG